LYWTRTNSRGTLLDAVSVPEDVQEPLSDGEDV